MSEPGEMTSDATAIPDGVFHADAIIVGFDGYKCEEFSPETLGLSQEVADQVAYILRGENCASIYLKPGITDDCDIPNIIPVDSNFRFKGTLFGMVKDGGYNLQEGQMVYNAFVGVCGKFPDTSIKAVGIEMRPTGSEATEMQARIEMSDLGELLLRVHVWKGNGQLISFDGQAFLDLVAGTQVLTDENLKLFEAFSVAPPNQSLIDQSVGEKEKTPAKTDIVTTETPPANAYLENPGCSAPGSTARPPDTMTPIFSLVAVLLIGHAIRQRTKVSLMNAIRGFFQK